MQEAIRHGGRAADGRPTREQIEPAACSLVERHSMQLIATARRYSLSAEDAEDAYQRGLEILLTRAPSLAEDDLVPWLKTVVKHEAFAIRKQRQRAEVIGGSEFVAGYVPAAHEQAERLERLRVGVEAMSRLKPQEVRCLMLRAEGYSYKQICEETGWTYTKVNRCIAEGRRSFLDRVAGIESGAECERMAPALSRLVDGEASPDDMALLRPHLRSCLACRATLRDYRDAPARVAAFAPLLITPHIFARGLRWLQHAFSQVGAQKTAAVLAVAATVAGGGVAAVHGVDRAHHKPPPSHHRTLHPRAFAAPIAHIARARTRPKPTTIKHKRHKGKAHKAAATTHTISAPPTQTYAAPVPPPEPTPAPAKPAPTSSSSEFGP